MPMECLQRQWVRLVAAYAAELNFNKPSIYAANQRHWEAERILTTCLDRWTTETCPRKGPLSNEDAKGCLGFEDYHRRKLWGIKCHWYLSFVVYSLLGDQGPPGRSGWAVQGQFESRGQRC
jgi:hypothetical protein